MAKLTALLKLNGIRGKIFFFTMLVVFIVTISVEFLMLHFRGDTILKSTLNLAVSKTVFIASNSAGIVVFNDDESMSALLEGIKADPHVLMVKVYQYNKESNANSKVNNNAVSLFASYQTHNGGGFVEPPELNNSERQYPDYIEVSREVIVSGKPVGLVLLHYDTFALKEYQQQAVGILLIGLVIAALITFIISGLFLKRFTHSIDSLVASTRNIASSQDYSVRVAKVSQDEMGELADNFNQMMAVIFSKDEQQRLKEVEIKKLNEHLEERVYARTIELEEAKDRAEAAGAVKAAFLANMSHEIRTPMNSIIGFLELVLENTSLGKEDRDSVNIAYNSAHHLLNIINDILDISKFDSDKMILDSQEFVLLEELQEVQQTLGGKAASKNLSIELDIEKTLASCYLGDPSRLRQILVNLVGNAIKFTATGSITIKVNSTEQKHVLHFQVVDTGIGIAKEKIANIFDSFSQEDTSTTRKYGGTGLGLTISKKIVELMGGKIWVDSLQGVGSIFHFTVKLKTITGSAKLVNAQLGKEKRPPFSPRRFKVLLAEDIPENYELARIRLEEQHHQVTIVENGALAVEAVSNNDFDIVLMDVHMPEMDGLEATRKIRQMEAGTDKHSIIVALTASLLQEERSLCFAAGMDDVSGKPIDLEDLYSTMERAVPKGAGLKVTDPEGTVEEADTKQAQVTQPHNLDLSCLSLVADVSRAMGVWQDAAIYCKNLRSFVYTHNEDVAQLAKAIAANELTQAREINHAIKGVAGNLALLDLQKACLDFSKALQSEQQSELEQKLAVIRLKFSEVKQAVLLLEDVSSVATLSSKYDPVAITKLVEQLNQALDGGELPDALIDELLLKLRGHVNDDRLYDFVTAVNLFDLENAKLALAECLKTQVER